MGEAEKEAKDETLNEAEIKAWRETGPEAVGKTEARARVAAEVETRNKAGAVACSERAIGRGRGGQVITKHFYRFFFCLPTPSTPPPPYAPPIPPPDDDVNMSSHTLVSL